VARPRDDRQKDLLRPALEEIIDLGHPLVRLAREIDWGFLDRRLASVCTTGPGQPGLPTDPAGGGLFILKHMHTLSDEVLCARWLGEPLLPILLRRAELLPPAAVRPLITDALAPAAG
jgi:IS5 family transposase